MSRKEICCFQLNTVSCHDFDNLRRHEFIDIYTCQVCCLLYVLICWTFRNSTFYRRTAFVFVCFVFFFCSQHKSLLPCTTLTDWFRNWDKVYLRLARGTIYCLNKRRTCWLPFILQRVKLINAILFRVQNLTSPT